MTRLIITGEMRSGTTMIANLLNAQENITVYRDFLHIQRLRKRIGVSSLVSKLSPVQKTKLIDEFYRDNARLGVILELNIGNFDNLLEFYLHVLQRIASPGDMVVGHKTTVAHNVVGELLELVPDLKVIYMLRDPRDVVVSAVKRFNEKSPFNFIRSWRQGYTQIKTYTNEAQFPPRIMILHYEAVLLQSDRTLTEVAEFLGIDYIVVPEQMTDYGKVWQDNSSFGGIKKMLDSTPIGRWRDLNPMAGRVTEVLLYKAMTEAGYEVSKDVSRPERTRAQFLYFTYLLTVRPLSLAYRLFRRGVSKLLRMIRHYCRNGVLS